jgi:PAS domain S-box-containing protein
MTNRERADDSRGAVVLDRPPPGGAAVAPASLAMVAEAAREIAGAGEDEAVGQLIVEQVAQVLQASDVRLVLFEPDRQWLRVAYAVGPSVERLGTRLPPGHSALPRLLDGGEPVVLGPDAPQTAASVPPPASRAVALVQVKGQVLGYLAVGRPAALPPYTADDLPALQVLGDLAGLRLGYSQRAVRPGHREQDLAGLRPAWRLPAEQAGDFLMVADLEGRLVDTDAAAPRYLGYSREELLQLAIQDISPPPFGIDDRESLRDLYQRVRESGGVTMESSLRRRDDTLFPIRLHLDPVPYGGTVAIRGICWDLTEQKEAHARLLHIERLRILGQMASGVAHDLNNTLAHVLGNLQLLLDSVDHPAQRALLERVQQAALDGAETVRRLHTFARTRETEAEQVDLSAVVVEVAELTRPSWEAATQQSGLPVDLVVDVAPVPPVLGSAAEFREVLVNLVHNALDALPQGGTVRMRTEAHNDEVVVTVADNGMGMAPRVRHRIFDPFYTTKGAKGSGLGLSVAYTIVARHKGQIAVESEEGQGTTFTIRLPAIAPPSAEPVVPPPAVEALPAEAAPGRQHGRIVVVDDERDLAVMLARMLQGEGHEVRVCTRGAEALELIEREPFDVLLTDVSMPDMDGWEVARRVKEVRPELPVAVVTGWGSQFEGTDLAARGVDYLLAKPFTVTAARELVARALTQPAGATEASG